MRIILQSALTAVLIAAPVCSKAAPRTIDGCEKIQAADAYNQCLALFGPVPHGHRLVRASANEASRQDEGVAEASGTNALAAADEDLGHHGRHHARRHGWGRHRWARHGHWHHTAAAAHAHGKRTIVAFSTVSGRAHLR